MCTVRTKVLHKTTSTPTPTADSTATTLNASLFDLQFNLLTPSGYFTYHQV
jgi:hypothetical protein